MSVIDAFPSWSILIADDEPAHSEAIRRVLLSATPDARVRIASTLREYRAMVSEEPPLIALVDMNMPDGKATDVLTAPAEDGQFPILVMTSFGDQKMAVDTLKAGAIDYFPKTDQSIAAVPRLVARGMREWALLRERKYSQDLLRSSEERYRALFENANDGILLLKDGVITECNPSACRLFGLDRDQVILRTPAHFSPELQPDGQASEQASAALFELVLAGAPQVFEWQHRRDDGTLFDAEVSLSRLAIHGETLVQAVMRDVTDRKRLHEILAAKNQELLRALRTRDRFLASMSHELRTPLNAIIGLAGLILMELPGPLTPKQVEYMQGIRTSAVHLTSIINDLLDLSRLESGHTEVQRVALHPLEVLEEVMAALRPMVAEKNLQFTLTQPGQPVMIQTDRRLLRQILFNLISNAVKFTDAGSVSVALEAGADQVRIHVADTGIGIPFDDQKRLFSEFTRLHAESHPGKEGTGLGLYLSQRMAVLLGGKIDFVSAPDKGSTFTLVLNQPLSTAA